MKSKNTNLNDLTPAQFTHEMFGTVRVLKKDDGEVWFVAKDVCDALGLETNNIQRDLDEDERMTLNKRAIGINERGNQNLLLINESGLYSLVLRSRKPEAKKFKKWVTSEVLPSIRKNGAYVNKQLADPSWLREMADVIERKNMEIAEKNAALAEVKPKAICAENLTADMSRFKPTHLAGMLKVPYVIFRYIAENEGIVAAHLLNGRYDLWRFVPTKMAYDKGYVVDRPCCASGVDYDFTPAGAKHMIEALRQRGYEVPEVI